MGVRYDFNTGREDLLGTHEAPVRCVEYSHATGEQTIPFPCCSWMWQLKAEFLVNLVFNFVPGSPTVLGLPLVLCALDFIRDSGLLLEKLTRQVHVLGFVSVY